MNFYKLGLVLFFMTFILSTPTNQAQVLASVNPNMSRALYVGNTIVGGTTNVGGQPITSINTSALPTGNMSYAVTNQNGQIVGGFTNLGSTITGRVLGQNIPTTTSNTSSFVVPPNANASFTGAGSGSLIQGDSSGGSGLDLTIPLLILGALLILK